MDNLNKFRKVLINFVNFRPALTSLDNFDMFRPILTDLVKFEQV